MDMQVLPAIFINYLLVNLTFWLNFVQRVTEDRKGDLEERGEGRSWRREICKRMKSRMKLAHFHIRIAWDNVLFCTHFNTKVKIFQLTRVNVELCKKINIVMNISI